MFETATHLIHDAKKIVIIQAENPDGDSLGSALALEEILGDLGKEVSLYCPVEIPKYMRFIQGWDRVTTNFDTHADLAIIVDTTADVLITKVLDTPGVRHFLESHPVLVIDHHPGDSNLSFNHTLLAEDAVATSEIIYKFAADNSWSINQQAAENMLVAIKTYPDGKITGKLRANLPIAETVAGYFGGGGHKYASGFRAYESYDTIISELVTATDKALRDHDTQTT